MRRESSVADGRETTGRFRAQLLRPLGALAAFPIAVLGVVAAPRSTPVATGPGVIKVETGRPTLAFQGRSFGTVGRYEKIRGTISGAVDPTDPRNSLITDLANAPRNRQGLVEYKADFMLLRPVDLSKGNHRVVYEPTNRGNVVSRRRSSTPPSNSGGRAPHGRTVLGDPRGDGA